jgi:hypothetical protein
MAVDKQELINTFDSELEKLLSVMEETLVLANPEIYKAKKTPVEGVRLLNFKNFFYDIKEDTQYTEKLYRKMHACFTTWGNINRQDVMNWINIEESKANKVITYADEWIKNNDITIDIRKSMRVTSDAENKALAKYVINLSAIYKKAIEVEISTQAEMDAGESINPLNLNRRSLIALHLMRIYYHLSDKATQECMIASINYIERTIGAKLTKGEARATAGGGNFFQNLLETSKDVIRGVDGKAASFFDNIPKNTISDENVLGVFKKIINDPKTKDIVGNISKKTSTCKGVKDIVNVLAETVNDEDGVGELTKAVKSIVEESVNSDTINISTPTVPPTVDVQDLDI